MWNTVDVYLLSVSMVIIMGMRHAAVHEMLMCSALSQWVSCYIRELNHCIPNTFCVDTFLSYAIYSALVCYAWHSTVAFLPFHDTCSMFSNLPYVYISLTLVPVNNSRWHMVLFLLYLTNMTRGMRDHKNGWKHQHALGTWVNFFKMWNIQPPVRPPHVWNCILVDTITFQETVLLQYHNC